MKAEAQHRTYVQDLHEPAHILRNLQEDAKSVDKQVQVLHDRGSGLDILAEVAAGVGKAFENVDEPIAGDGAALGLQSVTTGPRSACLKRKTPEWPSASLSPETSQGERLANV